MLQSLQHNIVNKLAIINSEYYDQKSLKTLLQTVLPLGFSQNLKDVQNVALVMSKSIQSIEQLAIFDQNPYLVDLMIGVISYWLSTPNIRQELFVI